MVSREAQAVIKDYVFDQQYVSETRITFMKGKGDVPVHHYSKKKRKLKNTLLHAIHKCAADPARLDPLFLPFFDKFLALERFLAEIDLIKKNEPEDMNNGLMNKSIGPIKSLILKGESHNFNAQKEFIDRKDTYLRLGYVKESGFSQLELESLFEFKPLQTGHFKNLYLLNNTYLEEFFKTYVNRSFANNYLFIAFPIVASLVQLGFLLSTSQPVMGAKSIVALIIWANILLNSICLIFIRQFMDYHQSYLIKGYFYICACLILAIPPFFLNSFSTMTHLAAMQLLILLFFASVNQIFPLASAIFFQAFVLALIAVVHVVFARVVPHRLSLFPSLINFAFIGLVLLRKKSDFIQHEIDFFNNSHLEL